MKKARLEFELQEITEYVLLMRFPRCQYIFIRRTIQTRNGVCNSPGQTARATTAIKPPQKESNPGRLIIIGTATGKSFRQRRDMGGLMLASVQTMAKVKEAFADVALPSKAEEDVEMDSVSEDDAEGEEVVDAPTSSA
jgi:hypothetical protein